MQEYRYFDPEQQRWLESCLTAVSQEAKQECRWFWSRSNRKLCFEYQISRFAPYKPVTYCTHGWPSSSNGLWNENVIFLFPLHVFFTDPLHTEFILQTKSSYFFLETQYSTFLMSKESLYCFRRGFGLQNKVSKRMLICCLLIPLLCMITFHHSFIY